jgi:hypothetical protein
MAIAQVSFWVTKGIAGRIRVQISEHAAHGRRSTEWKRKAKQVGGDVAAVVGMSMQVLRTPQFWYLTELCRSLRELHSTPTSRAINPMSYGTASAN